MGPMGNLDFERFRQISLDDFFHQFRQQTDPALTCIQLPNHGQKTVAKHTSPSRLNSKLWPHTLEQSILSSCKVGFCITLLRHVSQVSRNVWRVQMPQLNIRSSYATRRISRGI